MLLAGFLLVVTVLAFVAGKVTARREDGGAGCLPGCLITAVFGVLSLAAFLLYGLTLSGVALDALVDNGSIERVGLWIDEPPAPGPEGAWRDVAGGAAHDARELLHVLIDVRGDDLPTERLRRLVEEFTDGNAALTVSTLRDERGRPLSRLDFTVLLEEGDARRLEEQMRDLVADFQLPGGAYVEFRGIRRTW